MAQKSDPNLTQRKADHIDVVLGEKVDFGRLTAGFDAIRFEHCALPEMALSEVDLTGSFLGRSLKAPFLISSMTGGPARATQINENLSIAAEHLGIALGVGSQRVALETPDTGGLGKTLRKNASSIPLLGNIGAAQLLCPHAVDLARAAMDMIEADALFIHLNPLQEAIQPGGDTDWRGVRDAIGALQRAGIPIIVKEVGFGLSRTVISQLLDVGVTMFDVAGAGGTNWARVEGARGKNEKTRCLADSFTEWGIPTAQAISDAREVAQAATLIASGGIINGLDAAKAIRVGADLVGQAAPTLQAAIDGPEAVIAHFESMIETLRIACFCTESKTLSALREAPLQPTKAG
ncbi:MAG: type 2 isopentenyl-diphosphate Delta-isomerase [Parvularcula sp.]